MDLSIISALLRAISGVASNPAFGSAQAISAVASLGATLIEAGSAGEEGLKELTEQVQGMVSAGRNPTPDEFSSLRSRSDAAHAAIQNAGVKTPAVQSKKLETSVARTATAAPKPVAAQSAATKTATEQPAKPALSPSQTAAVLDGQGHAVTKDSGSVIPPKSGVSTNK